MFEMLFILIPITKTLETQYAKTKASCRNLSFNNFHTWKEFLLPYWALLKVILEFKVELRTINGDAKKKGIAFSHAVWIESTFLL